MARGQTFSHERIRRTDPTTGRDVLQLTSFPLPSTHLAYYYTCPTNGFAADSRTIVFLSRRSGDRHAPWDLFRVDVDGANLAQVSDRDHVGGIALSPTRRLTYYYHAGSLFTCHLDTFEEREVVHEEIGRPAWRDGSLPGQNVRAGYLSPDERWYFIRSMDPRGHEILIRHATDGTDTRILPMGERLKPQSIDLLGRGMVVTVLEGERRAFRIMDFDGNLHLRYGTNVFAHSCPLGKTGLWQGCAMYPRRAILTLAEGQEDASALVEGAYFWHSSGSLDGEWIIADTNWPNEGLQLVNVNTRRYRTLVHPQNSAGHPQPTHAHPLLSPDARYVAFNSDWTGIPQVWVMEIPGALRAELRT